MNIFIVARNFFVMYGAMVLRSLVIDAASRIFQVGTIENGHFIEFLSSEDHTVIGLFNLLEQIISENKFSEVIFCEGPGKTIGIRATLMFLRILKIVQPQMKIYSYTSLELAYKMRNPVDFSDILIDVDNSNGESTLSEESMKDIDYDEDEMDEIEFQKSLQQTAPEQATYSSNKDFFEDLVCVQKNQNQYFIFASNEIKEVDRATIEKMSQSVYALPTQTKQSNDDLTIPMEYLIELYPQEILSIRKENPLVETRFDPQGEFERWNHLRHK